MRETTRSKVGDVLAELDLFLPGLSYQETAGRLAASLGTGSLGDASSGELADVLAELDLSLPGLSYQETGRRLAASLGAGGLGDAPGSAGGSSQAFNVTITVASQTRTVRAEPFPNREDDTDTQPWRAVIPGFVAVIGRGAARYPAFILLDRWRDGDRPRPGTTRVTDEHGRQWTYHLQTCVRNRQARITGWADTTGITNYHDQTRT